MIARIEKDTGGGVRRGWATLEGPRSSYYLAATPSRRAQSDGLTGDRIKTIFQHHRRRSRCRRIVADLADQGQLCAASRVRRLMRERGLKAIQP